MKVTKKITVEAKQGLHARPASMFVQIANRFVSKIKVVKDDMEVDAKSILNILMLGVECGDEILLKIEGKDAEAALEELENIIKRDDF
jgi:phosphotransferase system HPr (HPr) family protein